MCDCSMFTIIISLIAISLVSGMIYGVLRNPGEPLAMTDEEMEREHEHAMHPKREFGIYAIIWIIVSVIWFLIMNNVGGFQ